jgi:hypothetical protein
VTESNDPTSSARRKDLSREPPTIDLEATVVSEGAQAAAAEGATADGTKTEAPLEAADPSPEMPPETPAGDPRSDAAATSAEPAEPRRAAPLGALATAGLLGGVVGAGVALAVQVWRAPPQEPDPRVAQIQRDVAALPRADALRGIEGRLGTLEGAQAPLGQRVEAAQALAAQAASRADEALNRPVPTSPPADGTDQGAAARDELGKRIAALEAQVQGLGSQLQERGQESAAAIQALDRRVAETAERLAALSREVAGGGSDATRAGTRVVLAQRLNDALRAGDPYGEVLAALSRFDADAARLAPLEPFAREGAPTGDALAREFRPLGDEIIRESRSGGTWPDRLLRMTERIVTIRPVNEPGATDVPSLVARTEQSLEQGRFAEALSAWNALPEPARRLSESFGQKLKQRAAAQDAARALADDAVAALNPATR